MTRCLTISDLSKLLQIRKRSIYFFAQTGKIPGAFKIGKHWRFRKDMIERWMDEQTKLQPMSRDTLPSPKKEVELKLKNR